MSLLDKLFGDPDLDRISDKIDQVFKVLDSNSDELTEDPIEDNTGKLVDSFLDQSAPEDISKIFQSISIPAERLARYTIYDEIYKSIPIIKRILKVYVANILQKNPVDGKCLIFRANPNILPGDEHIQKKANAEKFSRNVVDHFKLLEKIKKYIIPRKLLYGDCFVEIVDLRKEYDKVDFNKISQSVLTETTVNNLDAEISKLSNLKSSLTSTDFIVSKIADCLIEFSSNPLDQTILTEEERIEEKEKAAKAKDTSKEKAKIEDIIIKIHKPHNISILETDYGVTIGYLEIKEKLNLNVASDLGQSLQKMIGRITNIDRNSDTPKEKLVDKLLKYIVKSITTKVNSENKSKGDSDSAIRSLGDDTYNLIKRMFIEQGIFDKTGDLKPIRVRFIPVNKMVAFSNGSADYAPFGESVRTAAFVSNND